MSLIKVVNLKKTFQTYSQREGILGSLKDLVNRNYKELNAVDGITFSVEQGEMIGYIGPNGAGKSTSIKMLTGILKPSSGDIRVLGFEPFSDRKQYVHNIGVVFGQRTQLWWDIAAIESLKLLGKIYRVEDKLFKERLEELIEVLELKSFLNTPVRKLSLGQRIRCDLAASLIHNPAVLFLDEPTVGLDAVAKQSVRKFLRHINKTFKTTVILTTHDLDEIEELCKRILIIDKGKLIYDGAIEGIKALPGIETKVSVEFSRPILKESLNEAFTKDYRFVCEGDSRVDIFFDSQKNSVVEVIRKIVEKFPISDLKIAEPDIEEIIMKVYREGISK